MTRNTTTTYGYDATGSRAAWYRGGMTLRAAQLAARGALRHDGDQSTVYRYRQTARAAGPSEPIAHYELALHGPERWCLYVSRRDTLLPPRPARCRTLYAATTYTPATGRVQTRWSA